MVVVAVITDHCCHLIIDCKKIVVERIVARRIFENGGRDYSDDQPITNNHHQQSALIHEEVESKITYGEVGKESMGVWGLRLVNIALLVSQAGFCINYVIFIGNTLGTLFPFDSNYTNSSQYYVKVYIMLIANLYDFLT